MNTVHVPMIPLPRQGTKVSGRVYANEQIMLERLYTIGCITGLTPLGFMGSLETNPIERKQG